MLATHPTSPVSFFFRVLWRSGQAQAFQLTLASKSILSRLLFPELLNGQSHGVKDAGQVNINHRQIGLLKSCGPRVVGDPSTFADTSNRIDVIDATKSGDRLVKCLSLRVPVDHIHMGTCGNRTGPVQFGNNGLGPGYVTVCDKYFDAAVSSEKRVEERMTVVTCASRACEQ